MSGTEDLAETLSEAVHGEEPMENMRSGGGHFFDVQDASGRWYTVLVTVADHD